MTQADSSSGIGPGSAPPPPSGATERANVPLILISLGLGLVTVVATNWYVHRIKTQEAGDVVLVYKLSRTVEPGDTLRRRDLTEHRIPRAQYDDSMGAVTAADLPIQLNQKFERYAKASSVLTHNLFTPPGRGTGDQIEPQDGKRSLNIPVNSEYTPRTLAPDDMVDIRAILKIPGERTGSKLLMERVRVLGVGDRLIGMQGGSGHRSFNSVTIEVKPEEAAALTTIGRYAVDEEFILVERNRTDSTITIENASINPRVLQALGITMDTDTSP
jgi:Flp pilus assembly protein CpaB